MKTIINLNKEANRLITNDKSEKLAYIICTFTHKNALKVAKIVTPKSGKNKGKQITVYPLYHGREAVIQVLKDNNIYIHCLCDDWCLIQSKTDQVEKITKLVSPFSKVQVTIRENKNINLDIKKEKKPINNTTDKKEKIKRKQSNKINKITSRPKLHSKIKTTHSVGTKSTVKNVKKIVFKDKDKKVSITIHKKSHLTGSERKAAIRAKKENKKQHRKEMFKINQKMWFDLKHSDSDVVKELNKKHEFKKNNGKPIQQTLKFANQTTQIKKAA